MSSSSEWKQSSLLGTGAKGPKVAERGGVKWLISAWVCGAGAARRPVEELAPGGPLLAARGVHVGDALLHRLEGGRRLLADDDTIPDVDTGGGVAGGGGGARGG